HARRGGYGPAVQVEHRECWQRDWGSRWRDFGNAVTIRNSLAGRRPTDTWRITEDAGRILRTRSECARNRHERIPKVCLGVLKFGTAISTRYVNSKRAAHSQVAD